MITLGGVCVVLLGATHGLSQTVTVEDLLRQCAQEDDITARYQCYDMVLRSEASDPSTPPVDLPPQVQPSTPSVSPRHLSGTTAAAATLPQACQVFDNNTSINSPDLTIADCSAEGRWYHDAALTYRMDTAVISLGINNLFDKEPPRINNAPAGNRGGRVTSAGYDQIQRSFFLNVTKAF